MAREKITVLRSGTWVACLMPPAREVGRLLGPADYGHWTIDLGDRVVTVYRSWFDPCMPTEEEEAAWLLAKLAN